jgi:hypothetical protein
MMRFLKQLGFLRLGASRPARIEDDGRVLHLFRNRAELKKAYAELQDEIYRLRDRVKQQEGVTARVQDQLESLEERLARGPTGFNTLVFYHLRDLWGAGRELIVQMIGDLARAQEERERRQYLADFNRSQFERRQAVERDLNLAEVGAADVRAKIAELQAARVRAARWWHYFRRRDLDRRIQVMGFEQQTADETLAAARAASEALAAEPTPDFPGLSVEARRAINLAAIGYGEVLCLRLSKTPLVLLAREAMQRREPPDTYGDRQGCLGLLEDIARGKAILQHRSQVAQEVRVRSDRLKAHAKYRSSLDTVPTEESLVRAREAALDARLADGSAADATPLAVLRDDVWDLQRILLP